MEVAHARASSSGPETKLPASVHKAASSPPKTQRELVREQLLPVSKQDTYESQEVWRASNDKTAGHDGTVDSVSANAYRKAETEPPESSRRSRSNTAKGIGDQETPSRVSKKGGKGKKKKRPGTSSTSALSQKKPSIASSTKLAMSGTKPQKKMSLTSNPLQYDAQL